MRFLESSVMALFQVAGGRPPRMSLGHRSGAAGADAPMPQAPASPSQELQAEAIAEAKAKAAEAAAKASTVKEEPRWAYVDRRGHVDVLCLRAHL